MFYHQPLIFLVDLISRQQIIVHVITSGTIIGKDIGEDLDDVLSYQ